MKGCRPKSAKFENPILVEEGSINLTLLTDRRDHFTLVKKIIDSLLALRTRTKLAPLCVEKGMHVNSFLRPYVTHWGVSLARGFFKLENLNFCTLMGKGLSLWLESTVIATDVTRLSLNTHITKWLYGRKCRAHLHYILALTVGTPCNLHVPSRCTLIDSAYCHMERYC